MAGRAPAKSASAGITVSFEEERETKGTIRFSEVVGDMEEAKIGTLYVRKSTLAGMGWERGHSLTVSLS